MILYCADLPVFLFAVIGHINKYNQNEKIVLAVDKTNFEKKQMVQPVLNLKERGIVSDVVIQPMFLNVKRELIEEEYIDYFKTFFDQYFEKSGYKPTDFSKIYSLNDDYDGHINFYFNLNRINYIYLSVNKNSFYEDASHPSNGKYFQFLVNKYKFLTPFAEYALPEILSSTKHELKEKLKKRKEYTEWDDEELIKSFTKERVIEIVECFYLNQDFQSSGGSLLIVNSDGYFFHLMNTLDVLHRKKTGFYDELVSDVYVSMNKLAFDYYVTDCKEIWYKPHPNNPITDELLFEKYDGKVKKISDAPFELFVAYLKAKKIVLDQVIGYFSTSLDNVAEDITPHKLLLGREFVRTWSFYDSLYVLIKMADFLGYKSIVSTEPLFSQIKLIAEKNNLKSDCKKKDIITEFFEKEATPLKTEYFCVIDYLELKRKNISLNEILCCQKKNQTICVINAEYNDGFFESQFLDRIIILDVLLQPNHFNSDDREQHQTVFLFIPNKNIRLRVSEFMLTQDFYWRDITLKVRVKKSDEVVSYYAGKSLQSGMTFNRIETIDKRIDLILESQKYNTPLVSDLIKTNDFLIYLDLLKYFCKAYLIIIGTKDTPGSNMSVEVINKLRSLGFSLFSNKLWQMYSGCIYGDLTFFNISNPDKVEKNLILSDYLRIDVQCLSWTCGNKCKLEINNTDYSMNKRGINIVVYDIKNKMVIDSVCYDSHVQTLPNFYR